MLEPFFLEGDQILQFFNLFLSILEESHQKWFNLEWLHQFFIVFIDVIETEQNYWGHVDELEFIAFEMLPDLLLEDWSTDVLEDLGSGQEDSSGTVHPDRKDVEAKIDWVFTVVDPYPRNPASFEEQGISVYFSQVFHKDQDLRVH